MGHLSIGTFSAMSSISDCKPVDIPDDAKEQGLHESVVPQMTAPQVFHCKKLPTGVDPKTVIYVARPNLSIPPAIKSRYHQFANPFKNPNRKRSDIIRAYKAYLLACPSLVAEAKALLKGKHLACWCSPLPCHADVLLEIANSDGDSAKKCEDAK